MVTITDSMLREVSTQAKASPRLRMNYNLHRSHEDPFQRMLNAAEPGTYVPPHKHENPDRAEVFIILQGRVLVVEFDAEGGIADHIILDRAKGIFGVEIPPRAWHTFVALETGSVLFEAKEGPFIPHRHLAPWAPAEGAPEVAAYLAALLVRLKVA